MAAPLFYVFIPFARQDDKCVCVCIDTYIYISGCVEIDYELPLLPNNTASVTLFTQIGRGAKCWMDIYQWGAGLAVT